MNDHLHELDRRSSDGVSVTLLWRRRDDAVVVAVVDSRAEQSFELEVRDGERALDVFHHPFAYAAWHGVEPRAEQSALVT